MIENEVLNRIQYFLQFNHWSIYKLAKASAIPYSSLNNMFNRHTCPTVSTLEKICNGFQISLSEFFNFKNNPLRDTSISEEQQELINAYESLSPSDQKLLKAYLQGLCKR